MKNIEEIVEHYCKDGEIAEAIIDSLYFNGFGYIVKLKRKNKQLNKLLDKYCRMIELMSDGISYDEALKQTDS